MLRNKAFSPAKDSLEWPIQLKTPAALMQDLRDKARLKIIRSPLCSKIVLQIVGTFSAFVTHVLNDTRIHNKHTFEKELRRLELQHLSMTKKVCDEHHFKQPMSPLVTLSNHISCLDDPLLWGCLFPFTYYSLNSDTIRWSAAAAEICFSRPWHSILFSLGKTYPIVRGAGLDQPAMQFSLALLRYNQWLHLFPEGRVMRDSQQRPITNEDRGYKFKWGTAKLILDYLSTDRELPKNGCNTRQTSEKQLRILPFYHLGLDKIVPIGTNFPKSKGMITIYFRPNVIEMNQKLLKDILEKTELSSQISKSKSNDDIARIKLTRYLEEQVEKLVDPTTKLHEGYPKT